MAASLPTNFTVKFPSKIMDPAYKNKRTYITIYQSKAPSEIAEVLKDALKRVGSEFVQGVKAASTGDFSQMIKIMNQVKEFKGEEELTLVLPIPNQFQDSQDHSFNTDTGFVKDAIDNTAIGGKIDKVIGKVAANTSSSKILANPGFFQNYTGSTPRQFSFTFTLIPNSEKESEDIKKIILALKKYSSPSLKNSAIMIAPRFFWFRFSNETLQKLTGIRPCIINNISVNYSHSGTLETTFDGMPKGIELSVSISELRTITSEQWE